MKKKKNPNPKNLKNPKNKLKNQQLNTNQLKKPKLKKNQLKKETQLNQNLKNLWNNYIGKNTTGPTMVTKTLNGYHTINGKNNNKKKPNKLKLKRLLKKLLKKLKPKKLKKWWINQKNKNQQNQKKLLLNTPLNTNLLQYQLLNHTKITIMLNPTKIKDFYPYLHEILEINRGFYKKSLHYIPHEFLITISWYDLFHKFFVKFIIQKFNV